MADPAQLAVLHEGVEVWNASRAAANNAPVDLSGADLSRAKLNYANLLRANLAGATLTRAQLERAHLKDADLTGAVLDGANLEHVNARGAVFDRVTATGANFEVATLRGASFRNATLTGSRFHRAYLREADLTEADLSGAWLRLAVVEGARCHGTNFTGADLRYASFVDTDLCGARLTDVQVYGISAWNIETDSETQQDLVITIDTGDGETYLRTNDLQAAQLLALLLDGAEVRRILDSVASKLVLLLGSFAPAEKVVLDALREALRGKGYVAVVFDFERPAARDYAETVTVLAGLSRFIVADFTNAKEVRAEVLQARQQYRRVPIIPIAGTGVDLPVTAANYLDAADLRLLVRYTSVPDLLAKLQVSIIDPAESRAAQVAAEIATVEALLRGS